MDTEMPDASDLAELSSPPRSGVANGHGSSLQTPTPLMSRETSLPTKVQDQLNLGDSSEEGEEDSSDEDERRKEAVRQPPLPYSSLRTGYCYDARMRFHTELNPPSQRSDFHPEDPRRILAIYKTLCQAGLIDDKSFPPRTFLVPNSLKRLPCRHATKDEIITVHEVDHFNFLKTTAGTKNDVGLTILLTEHKAWTMSTF